MTFKVRFRLLHWQYFCGCSCICRWYCACSSKCLCYVQTVEYMWWLHFRVQYLVQCNQI